VLTSKGERTIKRNIITS